MGNGGPQQPGQARPPQIPRGAPAGLKDFVACKAASVTLRSGKINWIPELPEIDVTIAPGARPGEIEITAAWSFISLSLPVTVRDGRLEVDTSQVPDLVPGKDGITSWADRLNDWFRSNGRQLGPLEVKDGEVTLTKVAVPAAAQPAVGVPGTGTPTPAPTGPSGGSTVTTPGGAQPQPVAPAPTVPGPKLTREDVEAQRSKVEEARQRLDAEQKGREENAEHWDTFIKHRKAAEEMGAPLDNEAIERRREELNRESERVSDDYEEARRAFDDETARLRLMEKELQPEQAAPVGPTSGATGPWWKSWQAAAGLVAVLGGGLTGGLLLFGPGNEGPAGQPQQAAAPYPFGLFQPSGPVDTHAFTSPMERFILHKEGVEPGRSEQFVAIEEVAALDPLPRDPNSFPCDRVVEARTTVCATGADTEMRGEQVVISVRFADEVPLEGDDVLVYSAVFDSDGDPANDFQPFVDWDFFQATDRWYSLGYGPGRGWELGVTQLPTRRQGNVTDSQARAVIAGDMITFVVPASELPSPAGYRVTSFVHDGSFRPGKSGGQVAPGPPTDPFGLYVVDRPA